MKNLICTLFYSTLLLLTISNSVEAKKRKEVKNQGVHIEYTDTGKGKQTLLFVHGWCINKTYWDSQVAFFKNKYRVITMDLAGYGGSGKNRTVWGTDAFASDVNAVINQLHLKNVILIGHSMAGDIIAEAAALNPKPVIALIGVDNFKNTGIVNRDSVKSKKEFIAAIKQMKVNFKSVAYPYIKLQLFYKTTPDNVRRRVLYDVDHADTLIAVASMEHGDLDEVRALKKAGKPLFMVNSDVHPTDTTGLHAQHISAHVYYVHATGHYPMIEKPKEFNEALAKALTHIK